MFYAQFETIKIPDEYRQKHKIISEAKETAAALSGLDATLSDSAVVLRDSPVVLRDSPAVLRDPAVVLRDSSAEHVFGSCRIGIKSLPD